MCTAGSLHLGYVQKRGGEGCAGCVLRAVCIWAMCRRGEGKGVQDVYSAQSASGLCAEEGRGGMCRMCTAGSLHLGYVQKRGREGGAGCVLRAVCIWAMCRRGAGRGVQDVYCGQSASGLCAEEGQGGGCRMCTAGSLHLGYVQKRGREGGAGCELGFGFFGLCTEVRGVLNAGCAQWGRGVVCRM